ncbi:MFS transporter [Ferroplasma sp.]|uniref:MFS transporter n=1 Tax=Ferroplasma sp. TaxID=2591003 RepID=UPI00307EDB02
MMDNDIYSVIDNAKITKFQRRLAVTAALGPFTDAFNEFGSSVALIAVGIIFHLPAYLVAIALGAYWAGVAGGGILGGVISDRIGRRYLFLYDTIGMALFAILSAVSANYLEFFITRLGLGIFIGVDYAAAIPLLAEYSPSKQRGKLLSTEKLFFMFGTLATVLIGLGLTIDVGSLLAWRYDFLIAAVPALILFGLRFDMPASLRWAKKNGKKELIPKILKKLKKEGINIDPETITLEKQKGILGNAKEFFNRKNIRAIVYIFWIGAAYSLTVNLASVYASPELVSLGASSTTAVLGSFIIDLIGTVGVVITLLIVDKLGRRKMGTYGFMLGAIPMAILFIAAEMHLMSIPLLIIMFGIFFLINVGFVGTLQYLPAAEVSTTRSRGLAVGWEKLFEFGLALPMLTLYAIIGLKYSLLFDVIMSIVAGIIFYFVSFETKSKTLEQNAKYAVDMGHQSNKAPETEKE